MRKKTAIIFGCTGQDGSYLTEYLLSLNYIVHGVVRKTSSNLFINIQHIIDNKKYSNRLHIEKGDLLDPISVNRLIDIINPDEIYNLADQDHVAWSNAIPFYSFQVTSSSLLNILESIRYKNKKIKYFHPCSSNMFGKTTSKFQNENTRFNPQSPYAIAKSAAYFTMRYYRETYGLFASTAIFFNHESPRRPADYVSRKITSSVKKILEKKLKFLELGDISAKIDWGYSKEYVIAAHKMLQLNKPTDLVIGTGKEYSVEEFARDAFKYVGLEYKKYLKINKKFIRPATNSPLFADTSKAKKLINFKPTIYKKKLVDLMMKAELDNLNF